MTDYHDVGADTCASQLGQWRVMWRFLGMLFYGGIFMTRFLIRFLGGFFAFVGLGALADSAHSSVAYGVCDGVKLHYVSNGNVGKTAGVVSYTNESGAGWYVGWPNSGYSEMDYGARTLWYDMDGYNDFFNGADVYYNQAWQFPSRVGPAADSKLQKGCILAPDVDRICTSYYSGVTVSGLFCAGCATLGTMPGVLFAEGSGLFKNYGCCQYGETGSGISQCPCFFASTLSGVTVSDMNGDKHTAPAVIPQIYTYNFLNCQADTYQRVDSDDGHSYVLPWVSVTDASGEGTEMLQGRVKFVYQPGFWGDSAVGNTDQFVSYSASSCTFSNVYLDGVYGVAGLDRCATSGCAEIRTQSSGYWFEPRECSSCRKLTDNVYSEMSGEMVFKPTVSTIGAGAFLRSTFGPESCYLEKIGPFEGTNGSYEYSCDNYYKE